MFSIYHLESYFFWFIDLLDDKANGDFKIIEYLRKKRPRQNTGAENDIDTIVYNMILKLRYLPIFPKNNGTITRIIEDCLLRICLPAKLPDARIYLKSDLGRKEIESIHKLLIKKGCIREDEDEYFRILPYAAISSISHVYFEPSVTPNDYLDSFFGSGFYLNSCYERVKALSKNTIHELRSMLSEELSPEQSRLVKFVFERTANYLLAEGASDIDTVHFCCPVEPYEYTEYEIETFSVAIKNLLRKNTINKIRKILF